MDTKILPVVAKYVSKSDLRKTFNKISRTKTFTGQGKNPLNNSLVVVPTGSSGTLITVLRENGIKSISVLKNTACLLLTGK
jgi:hypothetical protein